MLADVLLDVQSASEVDLRGGVPAAVLVPLYRGAGGDLTTVLTERRHDLSRHAGEISFPGGRRDPEDATLAIAALREAEEEIGLPATAVEIVGALQPTSTFVTGYAIYPFVGVIEPGHTWAPSATEVAAVLDFPLSQIEAGYQRQVVERRGAAMWTDTYVVGEHVIWGATARILADLLMRVKRLG